jgi:hypothetical protein
MNLGLINRAIPHPVGWGPGGRRFESCLPDTEKPCKSPGSAGRSWVEPPAVAFYLYSILASLEAIDAQLFPAGATHAFPCDAVPRQFAQPLETQPVSPLTWRVPGPSVYGLITRRSRVRIPPPLWKNPLEIRGFSCLWPTEKPARGATGCNLEKKWPAGRSLTGGIPATSIT